MSAASSNGAGRGKDSALKEMGRSSFLDGPPRGGRVRRPAELDTEVITIVVVPELEAANAVPQAHNQALVLNPNPNPKPKVDDLGQGDSEYEAVVVRVQNGARIRGRELSTVCQSSTVK